MSILWHVAEQNAVYSHERIVIINRMEQTTDKQTATWTNLTDDTLSRGRQTQKEPLQSHYMKL